MEHWDDYIGVKLVSATARTKAEYAADRDQPMSGEDEDGYEVEYPDGYKSWCPKVQFESANRRTDGMPIGHAIEAVRCGKKVARKGWNGKDMYVFLREGRQITGVDTESPMGGDFESRSHLCMKDAEGKCVVGWLASQTDLLADDWFIVE